ncbi:small integral membrane protein 19 isoform X1 [Sorex araneus]|uniref:small integral membrane protein 19 isoform X1 n=1 Tax=Sorex araneus TaxID=42254 RepID=UPI0024334E9E|nr:small integral membrane protein 19 isoform X1 [Sorex araneus]
MPGSYSVMADDGSMDYSVHEAWNEATNVYLVVILVSFALFMYAKRNKRKIMRIFSVPSSAETLSEPNFYDTMSKIRLRQQLEMYSIYSSISVFEPHSGLTPDSCIGITSGGLWTSYAVLDIELESAKCKTAILKCGLSP